MFKCTDCNLSFTKPQHYSNHLHSRKHALNRIENLTSTNNPVLNVNQTDTIRSDNNDSINMINQQVNIFNIIL